MIDLNRADRALRIITELEALSGEDRTWLRNGLLLAANNDPRVATIAMRVVKVLGILMEVES